MIASFTLIFVLVQSLGLFLPTPAASLIGTVIVVYFWFALNMKRLHDRDKGAMPWAYIFFGPGILMQLMQLTGVGFTNTAISGESIMMQPNWLFIAVSLVGGLVAIWALVELGFLKGADGSNKYGPDPLAK